MSRTGAQWQGLGGLGKTLLHAPSSDKTRLNPAQLSPLRKSRGSVELFSLCDNSTIASSRHANSFVLSPAQRKSTVLSVSREEADKSLEAISHSDCAEIQEIKQKLRLQELRLHTFLKKLKERETEVKDLEARNKKVNKELADSQTTVARLQAQVTALERQLRDASALQNASASRVGHHQEKDSELSKLRSELSLLKSQYQAKLEAETLRLQPTSPAEVQRLTQELELALAKVKQVTVRNVQLQDEIAAYRDALETMKKKDGVCVISRQVSQEELLAMQRRFDEIEMMQQAMAEENRRLKKEAETSQTYDAEFRAQSLHLCSQLFRHRCSLAMFSRILEAMRDGEAFNLGVLLRSKTEAEHEQGTSLTDCEQEMSLVAKAFEELQSNAVAWYSEMCGDTCRVC